MFFFFKIKQQIRFCKWQGILTNLLHVFKKDSANGMRCFSFRNSKNKRKNLFHIWIGFLIIPSYLLSWQAGERYKLHVIVIYNLYLFSYLGTYRVIYHRVRNRKNYFEIAAILNFEWGTSRAGISNENKTTNKHISVTAKCNILWIFPLLIFLVQLAERREFQKNFSCSVPYHI